MPSMPVSMTSPHLQAPAPADAVHSVPTATATIHHPCHGESGHNSKSQSSANSNSISESNGEPCRAKGHRFERHSVPTTPSPYGLIPRLEIEVPNQPTAEELESNPLLHRFTLVFDREGADLLTAGCQQAIHCSTHKTK